MAYTLVRHLEHRVRLQYVKLRFALPSTIAPEAVKIYKLMGVSVKRLAYVL